MTIKLTDNLIAPSRGTVSAALAYGVTKRAKRQDFLAEYLAELWRLCQKYQFDFAILAAQSVNETNAWTSAIWQQYGNPAGIGVTGTDTSAGTNYSLVYKTGTDAARAHIVHMYAYVWGDVPESTEIADYVDLDPRYLAVFEAGYAGTVRDIAGFNVNGRWALLNNPPAYGTRIVNSGNDAWPGLPDQNDPPVTVPPGEDPEPIPGEGEPMAEYTFGLVPMPQYVDMIVPKQRAGQGYDPCPPRDIVGIVHHETQGDPPGEGLDELRWYYNFFSCPNGERCADALVDFCTARDGTLARFNDPFGTREPYASGGGVNNSNPVGKAWNQVFGSAARNYRLASNECIKNDTARLTAAQIETCAKLSAYFADHDGQKWDEFPTPKQYAPANVSPNHADIATTSCRLDDDQKEQINTRARAIMKQYQTGNGTTPIPVPVYATPDKPPAGTHIKNDRLFLAVTEEYVLTRDTTPYQYADFKSPTGSPLKKGSTVKITHVVSDAGASADLTLIIENGSRIDGKAVV